MAEKRDATPNTLSFPATLASEADKGQNFIRFEIHELQNGERLNLYNIHLYPPLGFATSDSGQYGSMDRGAMGAGMDAVLQSIGIKSSEETGLTSADMKALSAANVGLLTNVPGIDVIGRGARLAAMEKGIAQNPHTAVTYEGHNLRTFQMDFKMISESAKEAKEAAKIVDVLRNYSLPESTGALSIQYPAHFEIEFYKGEKKNPFMPKITTCHLTSLIATYNSTSNIFHADGSPMETEIQLTFQEIKTIVRQDLYNEEDGTALEGLDDKYEIDAEYLQNLGNADPEAATEAAPPPE